MSDSPLLSHEEPSEATLVFHEKPDGRRLARLPSGRIVLVDNREAATVKDGERWHVRLQHRDKVSIAQLVSRARPELTNPVIPASLSALLLSDAGDGGSANAGLPISRPNERLIEQLGKVPESLRKTWSPIAGPDALSDAELVSTARSAWSRFRLERVASVTGRPAMMLRGTVTPAELSPEERIDLLSGFDVGMLNRFAVTPNRKQLGPDLYELLRTLGTLPLRIDVRIMVWAGMLTQLGETELREELHSAAGLLETASAFDGADWIHVLLGALRRAADRTNDEDLKQVLLEAEAESPPTLVAVTGWAKRLEFPAAVPAAPPSSVASTDAIGPRFESIARTVDVTTLPVPSHTLVERWVLESSVVKAKLINLVSDLKEAIRELPSDGMPSFASFARVYEVVGAVSKTVEECLGSIPPPAELAVELGEAQAAYDLLSEQLDESTTSLLAEALHLNPDDVAGIAQILSRGEFLQLTPASAWSTDAVAPPADKGEQFRRLVESPVRARVAAALQALDEFTSLPQAHIREIGLRVAPFDAAVFRQALSQKAEGLVRLREVPANQRNWVEEALAAANDDDSVFRLVRRLEGLESSLNPAAFAPIAAAVHEAGTISGREEIVRRYEAAVDFVESNFSSARESTISQLNEWLAKHYKIARTGSVERGVELTIGHNLTDEVGRRAPLTFLPQKDVPYGLVSAPLAITTEKARDYDLALNVNVVGRDKRLNWLPSWDKTVPEELHILERDWRRGANDNLVFTFELQIPARPDEMENGLGIDITLTDLHTRRRIVTERGLTWNPPDEVTGDVVLNWPANVINPEFVRTHPIGLQKRFTRIESRLRAGGSFAALAPRRFGKTTLLEFIRSRSGELEMLCPESIPCTSFSDSGGDYDAIWRSISEQLQATLGGTALQGAVVDGLPGPRAFDYVRKEAARRDYRAILLLFDEAQLLFPKVGGFQLGDRFKDLIERHWSRPDAEGMAPVIFGFVGLLNFPDRAGINFTNFLEPEEGHELNEGDLNRILLAVTKDGLHTTREARLYLADVAPNLYLTRTLVGSLVDRVNSKNRRWVSYNDVREVERDIVNGLRLGREDRVGGLVRDALNDAPSVNMWKPSTLFPVALALAIARNEGVRGAQRLANRALQLVNEWCADVEVGLSTRLEYTETMIDADIAALGEQNIFEKGEFLSTFLEAWLVGEGRGGYPDSAKPALLRGASLRVRMPTGLTPMTEGGQAKVFRFTREGVRYALRRVELDNDQARARFVDNAHTLRHLSDGLVRREVGAEYLFDLDSVGFSDQDDMVGLQVYRWIDGQDLQSKVGQLPASLVTEIGYKLALGLKVLEKVSILHRDICPRNVILSDPEKNPVLVDFGLARLEAEALRTTLTSEYAAPEVQAQSPRWSRSADIYALGATLNALLNPTDKQGELLRGLLTSCLAPEPSDRPDPTDLARRLDLLRSRLHVEDQRSEIWVRVSEAVGTDGLKKWFWQVVEKFKPTFQVLGLGFHSDAFDRAAELAAFLDQVLESNPRPRGATQLKLGYVKNRNDDTGDTFVSPAFEFLHQLRLHVSHGDMKLSKARTLQRLGHPSPDQMHAYVLDAAGRIGEFLELPSLPGVITAALVTEAK